MSEMENSFSLPGDFKNKVRLFPLPNLVLFPGVVQALHVFEPRYREMASDAIASDNLLAMVLLLPGWENELQQPEIAKTVCVGQIISHAKLPDGRYNLFLVGGQRAKIVQELPFEKSYRQAEVTLIDEPEGIHLGNRRQRIISSFRELAQLEVNWNHEALDQFLSDDVPLSHLIDMISYASGAEPYEQQRILEACDLETRSELVLDLLKNKIAVKREESRSTFPPDFSLN